MVCSSAGNSGGLLLENVEQLLDMPSALQEIRVQREWNLMFPKGTLISNELIEQQHPVPLKYPVELEEKAKQAVLQENKKELKNVSGNWRTAIKKSFIHRQISNRRSFI